MLSADLNFTEIEWVVEEAKIGVHSAYWSSMSLTLDPCMTSGFI